MAFSDNLKYLRKKNGFTAEMLADELGVTLKTVSDWETNGVLPETEQLLAMCEMFNVTMDDLVRGDVAEGNDDGQKKTCANFKRRIGDICDCVITLLAVIIYLVLGFAANLWHPGWIIFIFALALCSLAEALTSGSLRSVKASGEFGGSIFLLAVAIYLILGFTADLWHPGWIIFIVAVAINCILGYFTERDKKD